MRMAICTMPGCQTSAGCKCNPPVYLAPFTPSPADEWYGNELAALNAEIELLRLSLSEARATGRREGMEWTVLYHDDLAAQHAAAHADVESDHHMMMERTHRRHAAAIRAAMEK